MVLDAFRPVLIACELSVCDTAQVFGVFRQFLSNVQRAERSRQDTDQRARDGDHQDVHQ